MSTPATEKKRHALCLPFPAQGHISPMLTLAKLIHASGFHVTFVNTEFNHRRLIRSHGPTSLSAHADFQYMTIPDGLPYCDEDATQDIVSLCCSTRNTCLPHFRDLLDRLNEPGAGIPRVTCIIADPLMSFALDAAKEIEVPCSLVWFSNAYTLMGYLKCPELISRGLAPLEDGSLDMQVCTNSNTKNVSLKDFPCLIPMKDCNDDMLDFLIYSMERRSKASAIIFNTFDELENPVLNAIKSILRTPIYTIGPSRLLANQIVSSSSVKSMGSNLWIEQPGCLEWLEGRDAQSVVYVNFGSITVLTNEQLVEFAWGLANSSYEFIWIIRPDLVRGNNAVLPPELLEKINDRSLLASWCPQEAVLRHKAIGAFLTHCGWNSVLESIYNGVPMLCWPFFADHPTICWCTCTKWEVGMEIDSVVKREEIERLIRKIMKGEEGKKMKEKAMEWKGSAIRATNPGGSSFVNFQRLLEEVLV